MIAYRNTYEHILVINLINVIYVVVFSQNDIAYRNTLEHIVILVFGTSFSHEWWNITTVQS